MLDEQATRHQPPSRHARLQNRPRLLALFPLAVAVGASISLGSAILAGVLALIGGAGALAATYGIRGRRRSLCTWEEVEDALERELHRARLRMGLRRLPASMAGAITRVSPSWTSNQRRQ